MGMASPTAPPRNKGSNKLCSSLLFHCSRQTIQTIDTPKNDDQWSHLGQLIVLKDNGCDTWSVTIRDENRLRVFDQKNVST